MLVCLFLVALLRLAEIGFGLGWILFSIRIVDMHLIEKRWMVIAMVEVVLYNNYACCLEGLKTTIEVVLSIKAIQRPLSPQESEKPLP